MSRDKSSVELNIESTDNSRKAFDSAQRSLKSTQKELDKATKNTKELGREFTVLGKSINLSPAVAGVGALTAGVGLATVALEDFLVTSEEVQIITNQISDLGIRSEISATQIGQLGVSIGSLADARQIFKRLLSSGDGIKQFSGRMMELVTLFDNLAKTTEFNSANQARNFSQALFSQDKTVELSAKGLNKLNERLQIFSNEQRTAIIEMARMGDKAGANELIFQRMNEVFGNINANDIGAQFRSLGAGMDLFFESIGSRIANEISPALPGLISFLKQASEFIGIEALSPVEAARKVVNDIKNEITTNQRLLDELKSDELSFSKGLRVVNFQLDSSIISIEKEIADTKLKLKDAEKGLELRVSMKINIDALNESDAESRMTSLRNKLESNAVNEVLKIDDKARRRIDKAVADALNLADAVGAEKRKSTDDTATLQRNENELTATREFISSTRDLNLEQLKNTSTFNSDHTLLLDKLISIKEEGLGEKRDIRERELALEKAAQSKEEQIERRRVSIQEEASKEKIGIMERELAASLKLFEEEQDARDRRDSRSKELNSNIADARNSAVSLRDNVTIKPVREQIEDDLSGGKKQAETLALAQVESKRLLSIREATSESEIKIINSVFDQRAEMIKSITQLERDALVEKLANDKTLTDSEQTQIETTIEMHKNASRLKSDLRERESSELESQLIRERDLRIQDGAVFEAWAMESATSMRVMAKDIGDGITRSIGDSLAKSFITGADATEVFKSAMASLAQSVISNLITISIQKTIASVMGNALTVKDTLAQQASTAAVTQSILISNALIAKSSGIAGSALALATAGASAATASIAYGTSLGAMTALNAASQATMLTGIAHGGLTNVQKEGTYLLDENERVLSPNQNRDLTDFIKSNNVNNQNMVLNFNVSAVDSTGIKQLLMKNMPFIAGQIQSASNSRGRRNG